MTTRALLDALVAAIDGGRWRAETDGIEAWIARLEARPPVTVLVPIYDGADHVRRLLGCEPLWREADEVLLVDDCSPDPAIGALLEQAESAHAHARVLRNARNMGFVRTVNLGLERRAAGSDVLVLNSDTLLGRGWAAAFAATAYAFADVATVSPLSNAAGFFSVPVSNRPNDVPPAWSVDECSRLLRWIAPALHEQALATSGFCWFVRGDALERLGRLDDLMFHRGYAEETDFCLRAGDAGLRNLCVLAHYVEHAGGESFTSERNVLKRTNARILRAMQPTFHGRLVEYEKGSRIPALGAAFGRMTALSPDRYGPTRGGAPLTIQLDASSCTGKAEEPSDRSAASASDLPPGEERSTLVLELGKARTVLRLGRHTRVLETDTERTDELASYLVLRLQAERVVDGVGSSDGLLARAADAIGCRFAPGVADPFDHPDPRPSR